MTPTALPRLGLIWAVFILLLGGTACEQGNEMGQHGTPRNDSFVKDAEQAITLARREALSQKIDIARYSVQAVIRKPDSWSVMFESLGSDKFGADHHFIVNVTTEGRITLMRGM